MKGPTDISIVTLDGTDSETVAAARAELTSAGNCANPRILVDLRTLTEVDGRVLATLFIASKELPKGARFAILVDDALMHTLEDWSLDTLWACFTDEKPAGVYLRADAAELPS